MCANGSRGVTIPCSHNARSVRRALLPTANSKSAGRTSPPRSTGPTTGRSCHFPGGGGFAEWLAQTKIESKHWEAHLSEIPLGRIPQLIADAKSRAAEWTNFADSLEERFKQLNRRRGVS